VHGKITVKILREFWERLVQMTERTGVSSITEFIVFVALNPAASGATSAEDRLTEEEVTAITARLKRVGYL
jgi:hypothetical protein